MAAHRAKVSEIIPKKVVDQDAETIQEIAQTHLVSERRMRDYVVGLLREGKVERVWKRAGNKLVPAYRTVTNTKEKK